MTKTFIHGNLKILTLLSVFIYRVIVDISFLYYVIPFSSYEQFVFQPNELKIVESYLVTILFSLLLPGITTRISTLIIYIFFILVVVPFHSYYGLGDQNQLAFYLGTAFWLLVVFFNKKLKNFPSFSINIKKMDSYIVLFIMVFSFITFFVLLYNFGVNINLDFSVVYEIRKNFIEQHIPLIGYLLNWSAKVFLPFLALLALFSLRKKTFYTSLMMVLFFEIYLFSVTGNKAYLFSLILSVFLGYIISKLNYFYKMNFIFAGLAALCLLSLLIFDDIWMGSLFLRRMLFIPAKLSYCYFEFFSENPFVYLSHSIMASFVSNPYTLDPPYLIGKVYFDKPEMSANNGIMIDGFMNFGIPGLIIWAAIFAVLLKLTDSVSRGKNIRIFAPLFIVSFINFVDGFLLTSLLTHGILAAFFIAFVYPPFSEITVDKKISIPK